MSRRPNALPSPRPSDPETTFGCVFAAGDFTEAALIIVYFAVPHRIRL